MTAIKVLSLFDGISCARVALERARIKVNRYYASEVDKYAITISQKNYPDIRHIGDVKKIRKGEFGNFDLVIGGSPCQDLSIAGKGKGLSGDRSGLFYEFVRIVKENKPKYFILENVASMKKEWQQIISDELWGIKPVMIDATLVSAQKRKRLFWVGRRVNYTGSSRSFYERVKIIQPKDRGIILKDIMDKNFDKSLIFTGKIGNSAGNRASGKNNKSVALKALGGGGGDETELYACALRGRHLVNGKRQDAKGARTEQRLEVGGDKAHTITSVQKDSLVLVIPEPTKKGYAVAENGDSIDVSFPGSQTRRGRVGKGKVKNLMASSQNICVVDKYIVRKLSPVECERLQSLPDNYTDGISKTQRYKCLGNAFNVEVIAHILGELFIKK